MIISKSVREVLFFLSVLVLISQLSQASRVSELTDRLLEIRKEGQWFVMVRSGLTSLNYYKKKFYLT